MAAGSGCRGDPVTIRAGLLLDGLGGQLRDALVTVVDGRIRSVASFQPGVAVTYDLSRYTVLPGLIDAHVHIGSYLNQHGMVGTLGDGQPETERAAARAANALATLRAGFTTVASMGALLDRELREQIDDGKIPGPRILTSLSPIRDTMASLLELRRDVRRLRAAGADFVKVFASRSPQQGGGPLFSAEQLSTICTEASRVRLFTVVHAMSDSSLRQAVEAGCETVEHGFFAGPDGLAAMASRGVFFDPQCRLVLQHFLEHRSMVSHLVGYDSAAFALMERMLPTLPVLTRAALATPKLKLIYGTDALAGSHGRNATDLICRVLDAGQSPMDALVAATSRNAEALGLGAEVGRIAPGFRADLIALEGNPLEAIEAVERVRFVMRDGKVFLGPGGAVPGSAP